jgi:hypothetical protein
LPKSEYITCAEYDILNLSTVRELNEIFKPPKLSDENAIKDPALSLLEAPSGWWKDCPVERTLLAYGTWEVFLEDCAEFGATLKQECSPGPKVDVVECVNEVHAACILNQALGCKKKDMAKAVFVWMMESITQK